MSISKADTNLNRPFESQEAQTAGQIENQQSLSAGTWGGMEASSPSASGSASRETEEIFARRGVPDLGFPTASIDLGNGKCST
ncbi:MAG: hypothetical protein AB7W16_03355 [Candidatus Obscuribacterales bacterium]